MDPGHLETLELGNPALGSQTLKVDVSIGMPVAIEYLPYIIAAHTPSVPSCDI